MVNCDVITSMKLNKFMDVHRTYEASITQLLTPRRPLLEVLPGDRMVYDGNLVFICVIVWSYLIYICKV